MLAFMSENLETPCGHGVVRTFLSVNLFLSVKFLPMLKTAFFRAVNAVRFTAFTEAFFIFLLTSSITRA